MGEGKGVRIINIEINSITISISIRVAVNKTVGLVICPHSFLTINLE